ILGQLRGQLAVAQAAAAFLRHAPPRAEVDLVDRHRGVQGVAHAAAGHPGLVTPGVVEGPDDGGRLGWHLLAEGERVGLVHAVAVVARGDVVLVAVAGADAGHEALPDAGRLLGPQRVARLVPAVEVAHDGDALGGGGPDGEVGAVLAAGRQRV